MVAFKATFKERGKKMEKAKRLLVCQDCLQVIQLNAFDGYLVCPTCNSINLINLTSKDGKLIDVDDLTILLD